MSIADQPYFPGFPQFNPKDFAEFMLFVYAELENLSERLERLEVRLLEEQLARPSRNGGGDG